MSDYFEGFVTKVFDGDTVEIDTVRFKRTNGYNYKDIERVRLVGFDAPELNAPGGKAARDRLARRVLGKYVRVYVTARDVFGRVLGRLELAAA
ncbi:MAG: thermonuclease family protein [Myxococcota bacterium]